MLVSLVDWEGLGRVYYVRVIVTFLNCSYGVLLYEYINKIILTLCKYMFSFILD